MSKTKMPYLSWSRYSLFLKSKREFHKRYILEQPQLPNKYFEKGKELGEYKETGEIPHYIDDPLLEAVGDAVPRLDLMEHEVKVKIKDYDLLMYSDSCKKDFTEFYEYKTGKLDSKTGNKPWDQHAVENHEQLDFYAVCYYIKSGIIPKATLYWIETEIQEINGEEVLRYTGHVESFERTFTEDDIVKMMTKILTVHQEIDEFEYTEMDVDIHFMERYIEISNTMKDLKQEADLMRLEIQTQMDAEGVQYAGNEKGRFSLSKRTTYNYSEELTKLDKDYKKEIKQKQEIEKKNGTAIKSVVDSLRFTLQK